jgi:hypothetical protein
MLHPLPIVTFGDIASLGLVLKVYCSRCHSWRPIDLHDEHLRARRFASLPAPPEPEGEQDRAREKGNDEEGLDQVIELHGAIT